MTQNTLLVLPPTLFSTAIHQRCDRFYGSIARYFDSKELRDIRLFGLAAQLTKTVSRRLHIRLVSHVQSEDTVLRRTNKLRELQLPVSQFRCYNISTADP